MEGRLRLVGPSQAVEMFGVILVGVNADNGMKLLFTVIFIGAVLLLGRALRWIAERMFATRSEQFGFWARQAIKLGTPCC